ncbi:hypothetical protein G6F63_016774 [Rhizopus arrhizus]|nr:hypothetical protein G6F63_016774 [Rhizopus arrhizus]
MDVDGAARVALQAGVEQPRRIGQRRPLGEGQLHRRLVGFARAEDAAMLPYRHPAPFPARRRASRPIRGSWRRSSRKR